jgi:hypothetical protein
MEQTTEDMSDKSFSPDFSSYSQVIQMVGTAGNYQSIPKPLQLPANGQAGHVTWPVIVSLNQGSDSQSK